MDVTRHLDFCNDDDPNEGREQPKPSAEAEERDADKRRTFVFHTPETKTVCLEDSSEPTFSDSMLKGMKGYQLTAGDLDFLQKMKEAKLSRELQGDLEEGQRSLKKEKMALELARASRDKAQAERDKFPSCEEFTEWATLVLNVTSPLIDLAGLDTKTLLAMLKIQGMMNQISDLTSELAQQEEAYNVCQMLLKTRKDIKEEAGAGASSEKLHMKHGRQERKKKEKLQDKTNHSKLTRSKRAEGKIDNQANVKETHPNKSTNETLQTSATKQAKQTAEAATDKLAKSVKAARGPLKRVEEQEPKSQESVQAGRGRRKTPCSTQAAAPQPTNPTKAKAGEDLSTSQQFTPSRSRGKAAAAQRDAGVQAQGSGLRRSKRIASRR
ncbi:hypothetical protein F2P81_002412 [Scophthalmus maximus]|uniref:Uncharacterized protein n=1 Tax=Scophthalmus maximus TaxID=52904 RepID=A0A6A4TIP7_SCOMX|nr:hypothetical protein F2P81_002412 [Scophthalmus maximus]